MVVVKTLKTFYTFHAVENFRDVKTFLKLGVKHHGNDEKLQGVVK